MFLLYPKFYHSVSMLPANWSTRQKLWVHRKKVLEVLFFGIFISPNPEPKQLGTATSDTSNVTALMQAFCIRTLNSTSAMALV